MASCLRSLSKRNLYTNWLCFKNSRPVLLSHTKDYSESSSFQDSSLLFRRRVLFEERKRQMSFVQPLGSFGVLLSRHMSSSRPEDLSETLGNVVEEPMVTKVSCIDECSTTIGNFSSPEDCVQYVINGIHELTGLNWWMSIVATSVLVNVLMSPVSIRALVQYLELRYLAKSIEKVKRVIQNCDPKSLSKYKKWEAQLTEDVGTLGLSFLGFLILDVYIYILFIKGVKKMAKTIPGFENGGILWFTDLSTPDSYILPLMISFTFWWTQEMLLSSNTNIVSKMKSLSWITFIFFVLQAGFKHQSAVYFYMIPSRICMCTILLMLKNQKLVKFRRFLGWPDNNQVRTVYEKQTTRLISLLKEYIDLLKKKHKL